MTEQTRHPTAKRYKEETKTAISKLIFVCVTILMVGSAIIFVCIAVFLVLKEWNKSDVGGG
ncbi:hypothetical protein THOM_2751 [Trachipleistophora hominis]|uniref:Uncharacterized protein n=1 Tax=Trachipleistophora hominis TaxID=72359 RepID=L7JS58_TRAHO|nr:hypothetical protein THOM_2751 [Trachipleistophora hominis]